MLEGAELCVALRTTYLLGKIALDDVLAIKDLDYHPWFLFGYLSGLSEATDQDWGIGRRKKFSCGSI